MEIKSKQELSQNKSYGHRKIKYEDRFLDMLATSGNAYRTTVFTEPKYNTEYRILTSQTHPKFLKVVRNWIRQKDFEFQDQFIRALRTRLGDFVLAIGLCSAESETSLVGLALFRLSTSTLEYVSVVPNVCPVKCTLLVALLLFQVGTLDRSLDNRKALPYRISNEGGIGGCTCYVRAALLNGLIPTVALGNKRRELNVTDCLRTYLGQRIQLQSTQQSTQQSMQQSPTRKNIKSK